MVSVANDKKATDASPLAVELKTKTKTKTKTKQPLRMSLFRNAKNKRNAEEEKVTKVEPEKENAGEEEEDDDNNGGGDDQQAGKRRN